MNLIDHPYLKEFRQKLVRGEFDQYLGDIRELTLSRDKIVEQQKLFELAEGQTVWFTDRTRPTYLIGREAKILEINRSRAVVALKDGGVGRFQGDRITVYPQHITPTKPTYAR